MSHLRLKDHQSHVSCGASADPGWVRRCRVHFVILEGGASGEGQGLKLAMFRGSSCGNRKLESSKLVLDDFIDLIGGYEFQSHNLSCAKQNLCLCK